MRCTIGVRRHSNKAAKTPSSEPRGGLGRSPPGRVRLDPLEQSRQLLQLRLHTRLHSLQVGARHLILVRLLLARQLGCQG